MERADTESLAEVLEHLCQAQSLPGGRSGLAHRAVPRSAVQSHQARSRTPKRAKSRARGPILARLPNPSLVA
jgi:hypothetical protein